MTSPIMLPDTRGVREDAPVLRDYGAMLTPFLCGPVQRIDRLGTRHALNVTIPRMQAEPDGRVWSSRLAQAKIYGALMWLRQDQLPIGNPGAPVVNGGGQSGTMLPIRGFTPGYRVVEGQWFSLLHTDGRRYLHRAAADTLADANGNLTLPIFPVLRVIVADGSTCEFAKPIIQGSLSGNELSFKRPIDGWFDFGTITISEDA